MLSLFGVPKGLVGITERTNYSTLYAALKTFYLMTLKPECTLLSGHLTKFLAWRFHRSLRIDFELPALGDPQLLEVQLSNDLRARIRTRNEWRAVRNLPPLRRSGAGHRQSGSRRIAGAAEEHAAKMFLDEWKRSALMDIRA